MLRTTLIAIAILLPMSVRAAPETYSCAHTSKPRFSEMGVVTQMIIDREARTIDMRDAATMGTSTELQWIFRDSGTPTDWLKWESGPSADMVVGLRAGIPYIFLRNGAQVGLSYGGTMPIPYDGWHCRG